MSIRITFFSVLFILISVLFCCIIVECKSDIYKLIIEGVSDYRALHGNPKISVLMPTYNRADFLSKSVESILSQEYKNFELIIVDDGSTDDSWILLWNYLKYDSRVRIYFNKKNHGISYTRNRLLDLAKGNYLACIDSDDLSYPNRLRRQSQYMEKHPDIAVTFSYTKINGKINDKYYFNGTTDEAMLNLLFMIPFTHSSMMIRKEFLKKYHIKYNELYPVAEDYELYYQIFINRGKFYIIPEYLVDVRIHHTNPEKYYSSRDANFNELRHKFQNIFIENEDDLFFISTKEKLQKILKANKKLKLLNEDVILRAIEKQTHDK